jgi:hypothetical protein
VCLTTTTQASAAERLDLIEAQLDALAEMPTGDAAAGDHLELAKRLVTVRRRVEATVARAWDGACQDFCVSGFGLMVS